MLANGSEFTLTLKRRWRLAAVLAMSFVLLIGVGSARAAATWTVTSTTDDASGNASACVSGTCPHLRDAVAKADSDSGDTILLPSSSTYSLTHGALSLSSNMTIKPSGANTPAISAGKNSTDFQIQSGTVTISHLTITDGNEIGGDGGAIGIEQPATLNLIDSTVSNSVAPDGGGGIWDGGILNLTGSTITGNSAPQDDSCACGGGIWDGHTVTIVNSTITGNSAGAAPPGSVGGGDGGGIYDVGTLNITNATIAANTVVPEPVDPAGANLAGSLTGGLALGGIQNTIIAYPKGGTNCDGNVPASKGNNLEDDSAKTCGFTQSSDLTGVDPKLGPLANNGGPTETMALLPGSPAIDRAATISSITTDQRGVHRPQGKAYDIGAFEVVVPAPSADMGIKKSGSPNPVTVGHTLTYTLKAKDHGPDAAANVKVTDKLPSGVTFVSVSSSQGSCSESGRKITCTLGTVQDGKSVTIKIKVTADKAGMITNTARVSSTTSDPKKSNNVAHAHTQVKAKPKPKPKPKPKFTG